MKPWQKRICFAATIEGMPCYPNWAEDGVPRCSDEKCGSYDGKRCRLLGFRPGTICEPAARAMAAEIDGAAA